MDTVQAIIYVNGTRYASLPDDQAARDTFADIVQSIGGNVSLYIENRKFGVHLLHLQSVTERKDTRHGNVAF